MTPEELRLASAAQTSEMLERACEYLKRLPRVPATLEMVREIEAHLAKPETAALIAEARMQFESRAKRVGRVYSPAGKLMVEVTIEGGTAICRVPILEGKRELPPQLSARLASGLPLGLD